MIIIFQNKNDEKIYEKKIKSTFVVGISSMDKLINFKESNLKENIALFRNDKNCKILCATNVVEEGLDIPDCNNVINLNEMRTIKEYIQKTGRARKDNSKLILFSKKAEECINKQRITQIQLSMKVMKQMIMENTFKPNVPIRHYIQNYNCFATEEMEQNFFLLGVTIVEDKLQDKVPETIQDLRNSGIKIWMLTGDKIDTAENISLSCNLITLENKNFKIKLSKSPWAEISHFFNEYSRFSNIQMSLDEGYESNTYSLSHDSQLKFSIIIDSPMLSYIFSKKALTQKFLQIAVNAESVVCCRVSPLQKSQVVQELKKINNDFTTLAIGDGGNDVSMILESHVGVGIYGEEGMLAVQSSDFSIGEFKYLRRLLFFHGRNSINRTGNMILYFFFKNFVFSILQFYFMFFDKDNGVWIE